MQTFLVILLILAMIATVVALVRGIISFLKTTEQELKSGEVSQSGLKQNRMMMARVGFQAIAVLLVALILLMSR